MTTSLKTERLTLCPCTAGDCPDFAALERDPSVMHFLNGGQAVDRASVDPDAPFLIPNGTEPFVWTARSVADGSFIGWFSLRPCDEGTAEIGYRLNPAAWGQGLASEGASALVDWGFATMCYDKIEANTMAVNHASRRVLEKAGLVYCRTVHGDWPTPVPGSEHGEVDYELTRAEWQER